MIIVKGKWRDNLPFFKDVDLIITDPPYGYGLKEVTWDNLDLGWLSPAYEYGSNDLVLLTFCASRLYHRVANKAEQEGFIIYDPISWITPSSFATSAGLRRRQDLIMVASKNPIRVDGSREEVGIIGDDKPLFPSQEYADNNTKMSFKRGDPNNRKEWRHAGTVVATEPISKEYDKFVLIKKAREKDGHFAAKPLLLADWLLNLFASPGKKFLDPFCGSGIFVEAADHHGLNALGIDLEPEK